MRTSVINTAKEINKKTALVLLVIFIVLVVYPSFSSFTTLNLLTRIFILSVFAMSYDVLRGYMGFIDLGHAIFFGGGAYAVGILFSKLGPTLPVFFLGILVILVYSIVCSLVMGKLSFKKGTTVFAAAMLTLALTEVVRNLAESMRDITNGTDGLIFKVPELLTNRVFFYYFALAFLIVMFIILRKFIMSPTGRVIIAIRENEQRVEFLGYKVEKYKMIAMLVSGISAGLAGAMFGTFNRFANTELLSMSMSTDALLYTLFGGTGTLYGAIIGTAIVNMFENFILGLRSVHPIFERWLLFSGSLYILVMLFMPQGVVGVVKQIRTAIAKKNKSKDEAESIEEKSPN